MDLIIFFALAMICLVVTMHISRQLWDVMDTPTVSPSGAIIGLCDIQGKAVPAVAPNGASLPWVTSPIAGGS